MNTDLKSKKNSVTGTKNTVDPKPPIVPMISEIKARIKNIIINHIKIIDNRFYEIIFPSTISMILSARFAKSIS